MNAKPGEHKTVQARHLEYAEDIGWTIVPREDAEQHRSFDSEAVTGNRMKGVSLFFDEAIKSYQALPLLFILCIYIVLRFHRIELRPYAPWEDK